MLKEIKELKYDWESVENFSDENNPSLSGKAELSVIDVYSTKTEVIVKFKVLEKGHRNKVIFDCFEMPYDLSKLKMLATAGGLALNGCLKLADLKDCRVMAQVGPRERKCKSGFTRKELFIFSYQT